MSSYTCPFCNHTIPLIPATSSETYAAFKHTANKHDTDYGLRIFFYNCPNCTQITSIAVYSGKKLPEKVIPIYPLSRAKTFPEYIPLAIRNDYEEACAILSLSPRASATLSRRCLQGMIHDFWNIKLKNLNQEITALKDKLSPDLWKSIDALRELGNIGAHMEKDTNLIIDIDTNEAAYLIQLIELLMDDWYITREKRKQLFSNIQNTNNAKQEERKKTE